MITVSGRGVPEGMSLAFLKVRRSIISVGSSGQRMVPRVKYGALSTATEPRFILVVPGRWGMLHATMFLIGMSGGQERHETKGGPSKKIILR